MPTDSSAELPQMVEWINQMVAAGIVLLVIGGGLIAVGVVVQKNGGRLFGKAWDARMLVMVGVAAMVIGSASPAVKFGSTLYQMAPVAEPKPITPAYERENDCSPVGFKTVDDLQKLKRLIGDEQYDKLSDSTDLEWKGQSLAQPKVRFEPFVDYRPKKQDGGCSQEPDPCFQVKITSKQKSNDFLPGMTEVSHWHESAGYDESTCGPSRRF